MHKYKVEIKVLNKYIIDVEANSKEEAQEKATDAFVVIKATNTEHYYQDGDTYEQVEMVFDVTDTDDPFNPVNN